ncbi:MAG: hypothetical protein K2N23_07145 [Clostridia bacterium]|nr:hypothetical protein [Clostridia bacterium]
MRRINLPLILDTLFAALCAFLLFFTSIRYYTRNAYIALTFAIAACLLFGALSYLYISKKQNKKLLISKDEKQKKLLSLHLSLSSDEYIKDLLKKSLASENEKPEFKNGKLTVGDNAYFYNFKMQPISEDDVAKVIKIKCEEKKIIFCNRISADALILCENFLIEVREIDYVYDLLKEKELLPEKYVYEGQKKINILKRIKARFSRRICAPLFWSGLALLALSYFTFFPIYYIVSGGIMLILSAVTLVLS